MSDSVHRRITDNGNGSKTYREILIRTVASIVVAIVLGCASGLLSAYVMVQVMQERIEGINTRNEMRHQMTDDRLRRLEDQVIRHVEKSDRNRVNGTAN